MWVLMVMLYAYSPGVGTVTTQEFTDQAKCEVAKEFANKAAGGPIHVAALCTPK